MSVNAKPNATAPDLSIVIGIRNWGLDRLEVAIRSHLSSTLRNIEIIISDYGSENREKVLEIANKYDCTYVYTKADTWSRSAALNAGIQIAKSDHILTTDADIIFSPRAHEVLLHGLIRVPNSVQIIQCRDLPQGFGADSLASFEWDQFLKVSTIRPRWGMGGSATFKKTLFAKIRGFDERMTVWGGEDNDFVQRARRSGALLNWVEHPEAQIYHIWHPPDSRGASSAEKKIVKQNEQILREDSSVLRNLSKIFHGTRGYTPTVSIVIATKNRPEMLKASVESCLNQTFQDFEILVIDDGSSEESRPTLSDFKDDRIRMLRLEESMGLAFARNYANAAAKGEFIAIHDDDDLMLPQRLEQQLSAVIDDYAGSYGGWIDFNDVTGKLAANPGRTTFNQPSLVFAGKTLVHAGVLIRRQVLQHYRYNEAFLANSDYHLLNRIARGGVKLNHCGNYVILRRLHSHNLTGTHATSQKSTSKISQAMARGAMSAALEQRYREAAKKNLYLIIDPETVLAAANYLPGHLLAKKFRAQFKEPRQFSPENARAITSLLQRTQGIGIEFNPGAVKGIQAITADFGTDSNLYNQFISSVAEIGEIDDAREITLPLAYASPSELKVDCQPVMLIPSKEANQIYLNGNLEDAIRILGKHSDHCGLSADNESKYILKLAPMKRAKEYLVHAKLNSVVANG